MIKLSSTQTEHFTERAKDVEMKTDSHHRAPQQTATTRAPLPEVAVNATAPLQDRFAAILLHCFDLESSGPDSTTQNIWEVDYFGTEPTHIRVPDDEPDWHWRMHYAVYLATQQIEHEHEAAVAHGVFWQVVAGIRDQSFQGSRDAMVSVSWQNSHDY